VHVLLYMSMFSSRPPFQQSIEPDPTEAGGLMDYVVGCVITLVVLAALVIAAIYQAPRDP
jgi:hypothetical protein